MTSPPVQKPPPPAPRPGPDYAVNDLLARIQAAYEQRQQLHFARIAELHQALEGYARAAEKDLTVDFAKRNGVEGAGELQAPDAALHLAALVDRLPEMSGSTAVPQPASVPAVYRRHSEPVAPAAMATIDEDEESSEALLLPKARQARRIVLVGGTPEPKKLPWLKSVLGYEPEWIKTEDDPDARSCQALAKRMHDVGGVVFFEGFMSHPQTDALQEGGRACGIPIVAAGKAGKGTIRRALIEIEGRL